MTVRVGVPVETARRERRVALVPDGASVRSRAGEGSRSAVEAGAGAHACFPDAAYRDAGATVVDARESVWGESDIVVKVQRLLVDEGRDAARRRGAGYCALVRGASGSGGAAAADPVLTALAERRVAALALERVPRITRAVDGCALVSGDRRGIQGGAHRRQRGAQAVPDADDGGRVDRAGQGVYRRGRGGRIAGDRNRSPIGCDRERV